jgi:hypothetical protein
MNDPDGGPVGSDMWIAIHGQQHERALLAQREDLSPEVLGQLVNDPDPVVIEQLGFNFLLEPSQIDDIIARYPRLRLTFAHNKSASARLRGELPILGNSDGNLYLFFQEVNASEPEIRAVQARRRAAWEHRDVAGPSPTLWDVWLSVRSPH